MEPNKEPTVDPAAIELGPVVEVTIDLSQLLQTQAAQRSRFEADQLESVDELATSASIAPLLGLIARSVSSALQLLELEHLRILVLLSQRDAISLVELSRLMRTTPRKLAKLLDAMESAEWLSTSRPARGIGETVAISAQGLVLVEQVTGQRQREIDGILERMSDEDRATVARAFSAFAAAADESALKPPTKSQEP